MGARTAGKTPSFEVPGIPVCLILMAAVRYQPFIQASFSLLPESVAGKPCAPWAKLPC